MGHRGGLKEQGGFRTVPYLKPLLHAERVEVSVHGEGAGAEEVRECPVVGGRVRTLLRYGDALTICIRNSDSSRKWVHHKFQCDLQALRHRAAAVSASFQLRVAIE